VGAVRKKYRLVAQCLGQALRAQQYRLPSVIDSHQINNAAVNGARVRFRRHDASDFHAPTLMGSPCIDWRAGARDVLNSDALNKVDSHGKLINHG
jgi:hypothetical protein